MVDANMQQKLLEGMDKGMMQERAGEIVQMGRVLVPDITHVESIPGTPHGS